MFLLSVLNVFVFVLPVESGEKASFVVTVFLSLVVFLTVVSSKLPENSDKISLLNIYVFTSTVMSTLIAVLTTILIRVHNRNTSIPVSNWLQQFVMLVCSSSNSTCSYGTEVKIDTISEQHDDDQETTVSYSVDEVIDKITWQDVVRTFDNVFFVVFLLLHFIIVITLFAVAMDK